MPSDTAGRREERRRVPFSLDEEGSGVAGVSFAGSDLDFDFRADREPDGCEDAAKGGGGGGAGVKPPGGSDRSISRAAAALMGRPELAMAASALETASLLEAPRGLSEIIVE
jgi:hypothetical protein